MTIYDEIKNYLEKSPKARERKNKNRFIAWLLWKRLQGVEVTQEMLEKFVVDCSSYDRAWRQVLQLETHLRGTDYDDKKMLEQEKELELGYQPGIQKDIKKVGEISKPYKD